MRTRPLFSTLPAVLALTLAWGVASPVWAQASDPPTLTQLRKQGENSSVTLEDGRVLTYSQLGPMNEVDLAKYRRQVTRRSDWNSFREWQLAVIEANNAEREKRIAELDKQLIVKYEQYVGNMERGAGGEKMVLQQILAQDFVPDALKQRIRALMVHPATRWRD